MHLESNKNTVQKSQQETFTFLTDVSNYNKIMPESIQKFDILSQDSFLFQLKGMPEIALQIQETNPNDTVVLGSKSDKLSFTLKANIKAIDDNTSEVQLLFDGEFNSMMAMMIKSPLKKFINTLSDNLGKL
ncbi:SRPBCC family protein [Mesonia aquimarina]|uniref:SRPBCC family protein n=1 Tax=Mesonia aquimarina TaxID=1504967 RepID=UPI000EF5F455|nr:SRPBCC family protein [Mesonia aquimarina]